MKTSKRFTEINNIRGITTKLQLEFAHNQEYFPSCFFRKVDQGLNSLMFQLSDRGVRYLSYKSVKYSFDITLLEWMASLLLLLLHDFCTTTSFLKWAGCIL